MSEPVRDEKQKKGVAKHIYKTFVEGPQKKMRELESTARIDPLTGLPNLRALNEQMDLLDGLWTRNHRQGIEEPKGAIIALDLTALHATNKTYGDPAGDQYLIDVSTSTNAAIRRDVDKAFRKGDRSDEYTLVLLGEEEKKGIEIVMDRVDLELKTREIEARKKYPGISYSVSMYGVTFGGQRPPLLAFNMAHTRINNLKSGAEAETGERGKYVGRHIIDKV